MKIDVESLRQAEAEAATAIYAIGDIHGRLDLLEAMEAAIAEDICATSPAFPLICYLGDYIDRGPRSSDVIARLSGPHLDGVPRIFLRGNHEDRMLDFLDRPDANGASWMKFGGLEALRSYGIDVPALEDQADWRAVRDRLRDVLPPEHLDFLMKSKVGLRWREHLFVHAGLNPARPEAEQDSHDLMWMREPFLSSDRNWSFTIVHGHVIVDRPEFHERRINIDTGAYRTGRLTCLVVSGGTSRLIEVAGGSSAEG